MIPALTRSVAEAWIRCMPRSGGGADATFSDGGGDSLLALTFVHELSTLVGRELPLDVVGMESTMADVARAVEALLAPAHVAATAAARPRLVLVTGAYGDEPGLAEFRRRLDGVDVQVVEPPGIAAADDVLGSMARLAAVVVEAVASVPSSVTVHLAGFSFGGSLALEAANVLTDAGRDVASLSLIDAPLSSDAVYQDFWAGRATSGRASWWLQTLPGRWRPLRLATARVMRRLHDGADMRLGLRRRLLHASRSGVLGGWAPAPPRVPTLLVLGEGLGERNAAGWAALAPDAMMVRVPGGHGDLFKGANLATVAKAVMAMTCAAPR